MISFLKGVFEEILSFRSSRYQDVTRKQIIYLVTRVVEHFSELFDLVQFFSTGPIITLKFSVLYPLVIYSLIKYFLFFLTFTERVCKLLTEYFLYVNKIQ